MRATRTAALITLASLVLAGCGLGLDEQRDEGRDRGYTAKVLSITDGDTIAVRIHRESEKVRLIGIDTPEVYGESECGGEGASASMKRMLRPGERVGLIPDRTQPGRDRYGRLLRYVERGGVDVGREQLERGWAEVLVVGADPRRLGPYESAERRAERAKRGAWGSCDPPPFETP